MANPLVLIISDTHIGGTTALAQPRFRLAEDTDEEREITLSMGQRWLWEDCWLPLVKRMKHEVRRRRRHLIVLHGGDVIDGHHPRRLQALPEVEDQERMAVELLEPLRALAKQMYICIGTEAHVGLVAQSERRIARLLNASLAHEHRLEIGGVLHSILHHGRTSSRTYYSRASSIAAEILMACAEHGYPVPRFAWRGHKHTIDDTGAKFSNIRVVTLPAWQLKNHYTWKVAPEKISDIGYVLVDGEQVEIVRHVPKRRPIRRVAV